MQAAVLRSFDLPLQIEDVTLAAPRDREVMVPWTTGTWVPGWEPKISLDQGLPDLLT